MASSAEDSPSPAAPRPGTLRIGVVAGEASGDVLGSRVLAALRRHCAHLTIEGIGGPQMQAQGLRSLFPMERLSVMGFVEPLARLPELLRIRGALYRHFRDNPPDLFLGIDAPDFNLRLERKLRGRGVPCAHLVSPSVWAWRQGRIRKIRRAVDLMLCLFPFETKIYREHQVPVRFVGHPMADEIATVVDLAAARSELGLPAQGKLLALLPGSRKSEVGQLAPLFLQAARQLQQGCPGLSCVIPAASDALHAQLTQILEQFPEVSVTLIRGQSRQVMAACNLVLLASGTATLEAALLKRPMVVAYRMTPVSWWLVSRLVRTRFAALPNVLADRPLVPELLQDAATPQAMAETLRPLLEGGDAGQRQAFAGLHQVLRQDFADTAAGALLELVATPEGAGHG